MWIPVTVISDRGSLDLHVRATAQSRVSDLATALAQHLGRPGLVRLATPRGPLAPADLLVSAGVRAGAVIEVVGEASHTGPAFSTARRELRVVAGPEAGLIVPMPERGIVRIGRASDNDVRLSDSKVSGTHAELVVIPESITLRDLRSTNGVAVDNTKVNQARIVAGQRIQIGANRLTVVDRVASGEVRADVDSQFRLRRPQRFRTPPTPDALHAPKPPDLGQKAQTTFSFAAITGLLGGLVAYLMFHSAVFLVLSGLSFLVGVVGSAVTLLRHRRGQAKARKEYAAAKASHDRDVQVALAQERDRRLRDAPDPAQVVSVATLPERRLWERAPADDDFVRLRTGMANLDSDLTVHQPDGKSMHLPMLDVPLEVDLATAGTIGIRGPRGNVHALARWLLLQATIQSGPADLRVAVLCRPGDRPAAVAWDFVRWLPHARAGSEALAFVGADESSLSARVESLAELVAQRLQAGTRSYGQSSLRAHRPQWLVVLDELPEVESPKLTEIVSRGPDVGVFVLALGQLPQRCPVEVTFDSESQAVVRRAGQAAVAGVLVDQVSVAVAEKTARALAPLEDPQLVTTSTGLPAEVSLLDLLSVGSLDPASLTESWARAPRQTRVPIGRTGVEPLFVDLVANGPHTLVAGQTGSGKSEALRTLVASLAAANRPDELGLILVDFKGGAAFAPFTGLPHVLGSITNLDRHAVMRVLESLEGDLNRRQRSFAAAGVDSLVRYHALADAGRLPAGCPLHLPRVYIVIDEFAILKNDLPPEIMDLLVRIAALGRSLGVHLVLGTQTPQGIIPQQMRANVNLRLAFRLDAAHSQDVIGVADAEHLAGAGRGYLRRGDDGELLLFQSAYLGGATRSRLGGAISVVEASFRRLGYLPAEDVAAGVSDLDVILNAITDAAALAGTVRTPPPWLDDLPAVLPLADVPAVVAPGELILPYGQEDQPELRLQPAAGWNLTTGTHLLVAGKPRSGRTTLLRTLAASIAAHPTDRVRFYVMDCGGALDDLSSLPHCGAVVTHHEIERGARLLDRLEGLLTAHENGARADTHTLLFIDGWEEWVQNFAEVDNGALLTQVVRLARRGPAARLHLAVTGGTNLVSSNQSRPLNESAQDRLALPFNPDDYRWLGLPATSVPADARPGLAVRLTAPHRTVQVAVLGASPDAAAQAGALRAFAAAVPVVAGTLPPRVDALPRSIRLAEARLKPRLGRPLDQGAYLGVGGDELHQVGIDIAGDGPGVYVTGQGRAERGNALLAIGADLLSRGIPVVALVPSPGSALNALKDSALLVNTPRDRQVMLLALGANEPPFVLLVDDAPQLERTDVDALLKGMLSRPEQPWWGMVVSAGIEDLAAPHPSSYLLELGRSGTGLVLGPRTARPQLFGSFARIPPAYVAGDPPGRGVLIRRSGSAEPVQVPTVTDADLAGLPALATGLPMLLQQAATAAGGALSTVEQVRAVLRDLRAATTG